MALRTISLFAGCDGLGLAVDLAARYLRIGEPRPLCYVEREAPAAAILAARFAEGSILPAPIWSDVSTFDGHRFRGMVDLMHGGFPCTDLSVAGKQAGITGKASGLWFEYVRIIREVQPRWVFIENVPPVLALPAGRAVFGKLSELGFDAEWLSLRASDVRASHQRKRVFILAHANERHDDGSGRRGKRWRFESSNRHVTMDDTPSPRYGTRQPGESGPLWDEARWAQPDGRRDDVGDTRCPERRSNDGTGGYRGEGRDGQGQAASRTSESSESLGDAACPGLGQVEQPPAGLWSSGQPERDGISLADAGREYRNLLKRSSEGSRIWAESVRGISELADSQCPPRSAEYEQDARERANGEQNQRAVLRQAGRELPLFPPGPGDATAWTSILSERPDLTPAISRFELIKQLAVAAGHLDISALGLTPEAFGEALGKACVASQAQSSIRELVDDVASILDERAAQLRAGGNGVVAIQGAVAFVELFRRFE